jgi:hypothetical protein
MTIRSQTTQCTPELEELYLDRIIERASIVCAHMPHGPCLRCLVGSLDQQRLAEVRGRRERRTDGLDRLLRDVIG